MNIMKELLKEVATHPGALKILEKVSRDELSIMEAALQIQKLIEGTSTGESLTRKLGKLNEMGIDPEKLLFRHPNGQEGLNPIFEAKLAERLSQDGDIPELRVGPLPEGCRPAVPVSTYTTNPLVIGLQLKKAREKVEGLLEAQQQRYVKSCSENTYLVPPSPPIDLPGFYEVGKSAIPISADPVGIGETSSLTAVEKRQLIHSCIGTTQGRVSCLSPIQALIRKKLDELGIRVKVVSNHNRYESSWTYQTWGSEDISEDFNPITTAALSMLNDFLEHTKDVSPKEVYFEVRPINGYSDRVFGWKITFYY